MGNNKVKRRSLIKKYISNELYLDVLKVTLISDINNFNFLFNFGHNLYNNDFISSN